MASAPLRSSLLCELKCGSEGRQRCMVSLTHRKERRQRSRWWATERKQLAKSLWWFICPPANFVPVMLVSFQARKQLDTPTPSVCYGIEENVSKATRQTKALVLTIFQSCCTPAANGLAQTDSRFKSLVVKPTSKRERVRQKKRKLRKKLKISDV